MFQSRKKKNYALQKMRRWRENQGERRDNHEGDLRYCASAQVQDLLNDNNEDFPLTKKQRDLRI